LYRKSKARRAGERGERSSAMRIAATIASRALAIRCVGPLTLIAPMIRPPSPNQGIEIEVTPSSVRSLKP
jgi:hypothetical protein